MAVRSLIDILWTNHGNTRQSGIFFVRALSEKEQILALAVEKDSLGMHKDPFGANLVQKIHNRSFKGKLAASTNSNFLIWWWRSLFCFRPVIQFLIKFDQKAKKFKILCLCWKLVLRSLWISWILIWQWCLLFCVGPVITFLKKFSPKNQNCLFKLKFGILTNVCTLNLMVVFTFSTLYRRDISFYISFKKLRTVKNQIWVKV